ncbi:alpha-ketoglutarate-dependent dioxygenase alkB homolog 7, mitochondrial [Daphnia magna]|uniref:alpha-ketoglutarate-dependent dioxygenase alkB homolog 7, mitochondrial n=1 Tax=Daphnia magna TaxID=35525 RepID=UPI001E1BDA46|nr:alpha-ketoglutarate-dependent dioxygenase alkB homolog 7, mitochondrial [Daphnia magna]
MALCLANVRPTWRRAIPLSAICSHSKALCFSSAESHAISPNLEFSPDCDEATKERLRGNMKIHEDFISAEEENNLLEELELKFKRSRYQYDHWDDAIHGYRETEKPTWNEVNNNVINRLRSFAFSTTTMQHVHVLDLAENGHIKPHLDSIKFCGNTISGISLLSPSIMRLIHIQRPEIFAKVLLPRRSLYIMKDFARYDFNHEILSNNESFFRGEKVTKTRRISVICRSPPPSS